MVYLIHFFFSSGEFHVNLWIFSWGKRWADHKVLSQAESQDSNIIVIQDSCIVSTKDWFSSGCIISYLGIHILDDNLDVMFLGCWTPSRQVDRNMHFFQASSDFVGDNANHEMIFLSSIGVRIRADDFPFLMAGSPLAWQNVVQLVLLNFINQDINLSRCIKTWDAPVFNLKVGFGDVHGSCISSVEPSLPFPIRLKASWDVLY